MRTAGSLLMLFGGCVALFAFGMDTTVSSSPTYVAGSLIGGGSTYNLGLLQHQMMILHVGLALFLAGAFLFGARGQESVAEREANAAYRREASIETEESDEEVQERLRRRRRQRIVAVIMLVVAVGLVGLLVFLSQLDSSPSGPMNVDENLTTTDMNATAVNQL